MVLVQEERQRHHGDTVTDAELDAIRGRAAKATPGPWEPVSGMIFPCEGDGPVVCSTDCEILVFGPRGAEAKAFEDQEFIAAARTDIPALLAEVERLRKALVSAKIKHNDAHRPCVYGQDPPEFYDEGGCICDANDHNAAIDKALAT